VCIFETSVLDSITRDTKLVAVSGVYFRGTWENAFTLERSSGNGSADYFYLNETHASETLTMMNQRGQLKYANLPDMRSEAVAVPFAVRQVHDVIIDFSIFFSVLGDLPRVRG